MNKEITDFSIILTELKGVGLNDYKMSDKTGIGRSMLTRLRSGKRNQPNYDDGAKIVKIYTKELGKKNLPMKTIENRKTD